MAAGILVTRIDRYVFRQLLVALISVTLALVGLIWLTQSLRFVELVVNHGLSLLVFLRLTSLLIPSFVAVILPITTFVVVQFVYQRLAGDRELTVMRATGMSPFELSRPALGLMVLVVGLCYALNLWLVPASYGAFREYQFEIRSRVAAFLLQEGVFTEVSDNLTVYVRTRDPDGTLHGIVVDDARQANNHATILAERGRLLPNGDAPRVLLQNGSRETIDHQTGRLNILTFGENVIDLAANDKGSDSRLRDITEMSVTELLAPEKAGIGPRDAPKFIAEAHKRLSSPLTAASFAMLALASVLKGQFRRHGGILRPLAAVAIAVGLLALGLGVGNVAAREPALISLIWLHAAAPGVICAWILYAQQWASRRLPRRAAASASVSGAA